MDDFPATRTDPDPTLPLAARFEQAGEGSDRHDGWTPERMAVFCARLAECGCVEQACATLGMARSGLYEARRRNPLFALAWEDALLEGALPRLADELLSVAFKGAVERYYRDGELVGEKHYTDTRLGLALLKRLDRRAAARDAADAARAAAPSRPAAPPPPPEPAELNEVDNLPFSTTLDRPHPRIARYEDGWRTSFPPPYEGDPLAEVPRAPAPPDDPDDPDEYDHPYARDPDMSDEASWDPLEIEDLPPEDRWMGSEGYVRRCTVAESVALDRWVDRMLAPQHAERAGFFAALADDGVPLHSVEPSIAAPPGLAAPPHLC